jgi:hypothetical protein
MGNYAGHLNRFMQRLDMAFEGSLMNEFIYKPGELLVHREDYSDDVRREIANWGGEQVDLPAELDLPGDYQILRFQLPPEINVPQLTGRLRQVAAGVAEPRIAPNYVFGAEQSRIPTPAGPPRPVGGGWAPTAEAAGDFAVGVVDTGVVLEDGQPHPNLAGHIRYGERDQDPLDADGDGWLDIYDGHGTFVAGIILERAPAATVHLRRGLDTGVNDDLAIAASIRNLAAQGIKLINLSFSGTADGYSYPLAVSEEIADLPLDVVVVAAAGNYGRIRPVWPAAFKRVIAVGSVVDAERRERAAWSNYGWWVDACSDGQDVVGPFCTFDERAQHDDEDAYRFTGWALWSGTSFAAPRVTGRIAELAITEGVSAREAADRVVRDPDRPQVRGLGTYVA